MAELDRVASREYLDEAGALRAQTRVDEAFLEAREQAAHLLTEVA
jgi:hypothetical protein